MHTQLMQGCCSEKVAQPGEVRASSAHLRRGRGIGLREQGDSRGEQRLLAFGKRQWLEIGFLVLLFQYKLHFHKTILTG